MVTMTIYQHVLPGDDRAAAGAGCEHDPRGAIDRVPRISYFYGIAIYIYYSDERRRTSMPATASTRRGSPLQRARYSADGFPAERPAW